jgi:hypothetical protein
VRQPARSMPLPAAPIRRSGIFLTLIPTTVVTWRNCRFGHKLRSTFVCWALAGPASGSQPDREVPDAHHDPSAAPRPGSAGVHEYRAAGVGRIPRGIQRPDPSPRRFIVPGQGAGPAIAQVNDCTHPTARLPTRTISPGPSCGAGWTSCRCHPSAPPPAWAAERLASRPRLSLTYERGGHGPAPRRALKPPGLGRASWRNCRWPRGAPPSPCRAGTGTGAPLSVRGS